jgi:hypothetical protein
MHGIFRQRHLSHTVWGTDHNVRMVLTPRPNNCFATLLLDTIVGNIVNTMIIMVISINIVCPHPIKYYYFETTQKSSLQKVITSPRDL